MQLLDAPESQKLFPPDVLKRAKEYLDATGSGGTGAYTHSQGVELCREHVAKVNTQFLQMHSELDILQTRCMCCNGSTSFGIVSLWSWCRQACNFTAYLAAMCAAI